MSELTQGETHQVSSDSSPAKRTVYVLDKPEGREWSRDAVVALVNLYGVEVQQMPHMPRKLVLMRRPKRGTPEGAAAAHDCSVREVDYHRRWE